MRITVGQREMNGWPALRNVNGSGFAGWTEASGVGDDGEPVADYMIFNEEGVENADGSERITARPAMAQSWDNNEDAYAERMERDGVRITGAMTGGDAAVRASLTGLTNMARNAIIGEILSPNPAFAENAPSTIAAKGSSRPLIDTGLAMARVVTGVEVG